MALVLVCTTPPPHVNAGNAQVPLLREMELKLCEMECVGVFGGWASGRGGVRDEVGLVSPEILETYENEINISNLSKGVYVIKIGNMTVRFIKE